MIILEARSLSKVYWEQKKSITAVRNVSLRLEAGEVLAFLGPNGAGKTTTIKMIAGLIMPDAGHVSIVGYNPHRTPLALKHLGAVLEGNRNLYWRLTPEENLEYFGVLRGLSRRVACQRGKILLEQFELTAKRHTPVQRLSRGMQQKLAIAVALVHQPQLLLLDEPTLGLDVEATQTVKRLVRQIAQEGRGILLTTHQLDIAEQLSDRVAIICQGELIAEEATTDLIQQFSGTAYTIETAVDIDPIRSNKLEALGVDFPQTRIIYVREPELLYSVLDILRPLPLVRVAKEQANLTDIFLSLVRETQTPA
jgi:ABC-2 type transport system ATP-binding protein